MRSTPLHPSFVLGLVAALVLALGLLLAPPIAGAPGAAVPLAVGGETEEPPGDCCVRGSV